MTGLLRKIGSAWMEMLHGESIEKPKVVLSRDWSAICSKCSIHILPVLATTVLAYLNIRGYFIGSSLQGLTGDVAQDIDRLCLQVTAKLFVGEVLLTAVTKADISAGAARRRLSGRHARRCYSR